MKSDKRNQQQPPRLQVALDFESLDEALALAKEVAPFIDILEAGTPLIKSEGVRAIQALKKEFPAKLVCADLKTADAGYLEVRMAAQAKADIVTVLADAYDITIEETLHAAHDFQVEVMADLIVSRSPAKRLEELIDLNYKGTKLHYALVHSGLDRQASRQGPLSELESVVGIARHPHLAVAGGIQIADISRITKLPLSIIIVGGAITRAKNPSMVAANFQKEIYKYTNIEKSKIL